MSIGTLVLWVLGVSFSVCVLCAATLAFMATINLLIEMYAAAKKAWSKRNCP